MREKFNVEEIKRAAEIVGSYNKLSLLLGVSVANVYKWRDGKSTPDPINCLKIQKLTNGLVKARDIRPDYDWDKVI